MKFAADHIYVGCERVSDFNIIIIDCAALIPLVYILLFWLLRSDLYSAFFCEDNYY